ncbi:uncharacterized protein CLUP02_05675 [Colletotrichum lupini]|uniref:Uncharacterized protein n=1 Tax=Colletotrichum lupini TaxID=145971 RepID=A0A9Q8SN81_9PEZI|nr:uncharacterized protein CLUP02_05675 [Colletotrichum lupini]UQC80193.1 hypothetical protein CLUP02_05675 [Colletotrichum lupini]
MSRCRYARKRFYAGAPFDPCWFNKGDKVAQTRRGRMAIAKANSNQIQCKAKTTSRGIMFIYTSRDVQVLIDGGWDSLYRVVVNKSGDPVVMDSEITVQGTRGLDPMQWRYGGRALKGGKRNFRDTNGSSYTESNVTEDAHIPDLLQTSI